MTHQEGNGQVQGAPRGGSAHVARSALLVALFFGFDKLLALVRDMLISRTFGASAELDAYYAAFELPDGLFTVVAGSALVTSFIPILSAQIAKRDREEVGRLVSAVLNLVLLVVAGVSVLAALFAPQIIAVVAPGFDAYRTTLATQLMRLVLLQTLVSSASGIAMSVLQAHQHFLLPAVAPLSYTLGRIAGVLFLAPTLGIFGLAVGGLLGTVGHFLIQVPGLLHYRIRWIPILRHPDLRRVLVLMGPRMLGLGATYLNFVLPTFLGSRLAPGAIAAYEYGWRLMQFPETIIGTALGLTIFPLLAERANAGDLAGLRRAAGWALRLVLSLAIPAAAGILLLGRPVTALLLEGRAFDAAATARVVYALHFLSLALVGHAALEVVSRAFFARRDMWTPFYAAVIGLLINAGLGWALLGTLEQGAIALANGVGVSAQVLILLGVARARWGGMDERALLLSLGRTLGATLVMTAAIWGVRALFPSGRGIIEMLTALVVGTGAYLLAAFLLKNDTLLELPRLLFGRSAGGEPPAGLRERL
ncbi:MAG: murein biosynthesis integral membrane protein MurJ [Anaerolineales bacterium]